MSAYFILSIDTECDKRPDWSTRYPFEFRNITEGIPRRLQPILAKHGVVPTYLLSPEVISAQDCQVVFRSHPGLYELGTHLHGEYIEPQADFDAKGTMAFQGDFAPAVEYEKMKNLTNLFERTFAQKPTSFRAGRFGMGPGTLKILNDLHYTVDSSVFPMHHVAMTTRVQNFFGAPTHAYFPDLNDYEKENPDTTLLELPISVYSPMYSRLPRRMRKPMARFSVMNQIVGKVLGRRFVKTHTLRPSLKVNDRSLFVAREHLRNQPDPLILMMMFHSNELTEATSPYWQTTEEIEEFLSELDRLFDFLNRKGVQFVRMADAWHIKKNLTRPSPVSYSKGIA